MGKPHYKTRTYIIWKAMLYRSRHRKDKSYSHVVVCKSWLKFENFLKDMGRCPSQYHSIDRIDNSKGYCPINCRWATARQQAENRGVTDWIYFDSKKGTLTSWARHLGIDRLTLHQRLYRLGWPIEKALTTPVRKFNGSIRRSKKRKKYKNQLKELELLNWWSNGPALGNVFRNGETGL